MLEKKYDFLEVQCSLSDMWQQSSIYKWNGGSDFIIDSPPPTISGDLHIGHLFSYCHADFIARYKRMSGFDVFYSMGFDDNGLPTERLVEKTYSINASESDPKHFANLCKNISESKRKQFKDVFNSIGLSVDWELEYNTMNERSRALSQMSFKHLYEKGLLYRDKKPVFWDTIQQTAISQADIDEREYESHMCYIKFASDAGDFLVATTRPELLSACVAVFVHPEDSRYFHLHNKTATTPIFNSQVNVLCDDLVRPEKGTGAVMCCTFGDELDIKWVKRHSLPIKIIISKNGKLISNDFLKDFSVLDARNIIIKELEKCNLLNKKEPIKHFIKCSERSGARIEILETYQWFIKLLEYKSQLLNQANSCNWYPSNMKIKIQQWIDSLEWDWCISRQRYFGVPFPVWYSKRDDEDVIISSKFPVNPKTDLPEGYSKTEVEPELDVMDTWATSSISPQINAGYINDKFQVTNSKQQIYPATMRPQAHEIIRSWAFYTIVKSYFHTGSLPWKDIVISGWCLAEDKSKMSKSKNNIISAQKAIDDYSADVIRYWASSSKLGSDFTYCTNTLKIGKKLVNKLWNSSRFVSQFLIKEYNIHDIDNYIDLWIMNKLGIVAKEMSESFDLYDYNRARESIEDFFWKFFCDHYLELVKSRAYNNDVSAMNCLSYMMDVILRLFAPFLPFVTDKIFLSLFREKSLHSLGSWPNYKSLINPIGSRVPDLYLIEIIKSVREFKTQKNVSIKFKTGVLKVEYVNPIILDIIDDIKSVCNVKDSKWLKCSKFSVFVSED